MVLAFFLRILAVVCCLTAVAPADDEIVREFKKYFRTYKDSATRVEAVLSLEGSESPAVVEALLPILRDEDTGVIEAGVRVLASFKEASAIAALTAALEAEKQEATRVGILRAMTRGKFAPQGPGLEEALADKSWAVRREAALAVAACSGGQMAPLLVPLCSDKEPAVRGAAFEALASLGSELVLGPARAALLDASWQVRSSALATLGRVRHRDSIEALIASLEREEGRLRDDAARALEALTGRYFGTRLELWQQFWQSNKERYQIPTDAELAELRAKQAARKAEYQPGTTTSYHGVETPSRSILFIIDVSGSMEHLVVEKERFEAGNYPSFVRMDIVKTELYRTIERLDPYVRFNVLAFATDVRAWKKDLVPANVLNRSSALSFVQKLEPIGGPSKEELASVGLVGAANLESGKTNTFGALMEGLGLGPDGNAKSDYKLEVDTIFFLSDGRPTYGRYVDHDDIRREVTAANSLRRVVIHCIAIGDFDKTFMERLAVENGGAFVDLGK